MFAKREQIIDNYYLVENESGSYDIGYRLDGGGYIGRNPPNTRVIAYAYKDSLLVMKVQPYRGEPSYYAINMKRDRDIAKREEYEMGSVAVMDYQKSWLSRLNLHFKEVK
jgi:hypothetical protein